MPSFKLILLNCIFAPYRLVMYGENREIMTFEGDREGPLLIIIAAIHGNEKAGVRALELVSKMLEVEPITNPQFNFRGKLCGVIGNMTALKKEVRFVDQDLNRMWNKANVTQIINKDTSQRNVEESELVALLKYINQQIELFAPKELYILDLHTTSSGGGIFSIPNYDPESFEIAQNLHAPVILDMLSSLSGTTLHYFNRTNISYPKTTSVTFEAGQHDDYLSVNRCIAAIINFLKSIGCVSGDHVENIHDEILISYSTDLPKTSRLLYRHAIIKSDKFIMKPGYNNFDPVRKDEILGFDKTGEIKSPNDGLILMPLYQSQGNDGFYIILPEEY